MSLEGESLTRWWTRLARVPGGKRLFGRLLFTFVPYSGTTKARIVDLEPGLVRLVLDDRRRIRNHLGSIHAIALTNVAELASGLSLVTGLAPDVRAIVVGLRMEFLKKARGRLVVEGRADIPTLDGPIEHEVQATIRNDDDEVVAECWVQWRLDRRQRGP